MWVVFYSPKGTISIFVLDLEYLVTVIPSQKNKDNYFYTIHVLLLCFNVFHIYYTFTRKSVQAVNTLTLFYFEYVLLRIIANIFIIIYCYNKVQSPLLKTGPRETCFVVVWSHLLKTT